MQTICILRTVYWISVLPNDFAFYNSWKNSDNSKTNLALVPVSIFPLYSFFSFRRHRGARRKRQLSQIGFVESYNCRPREKKCSLKLLPRLLFRMRLLFSEESNWWPWFRLVEKKLFPGFWDFRSSPEILYFFNIRATISNGCLNSFLRENCMYFFIWLFLVLYPIRTK